MRDLAIFIVIGWFWSIFYSVGPLNSASDLVAGGGAITCGSLLFALWGLHLGRRRVAATSPKRARHA